MPITDQAPVRSDEQRMEALKRANDIRIKRAELKKDLRKQGQTAAQLSVCSILGQPPEYVGTMKVMDLLLAIPKFGKVKVTRLLNESRMSQSKTVGGTSERQRRELIRKLGGELQREPTADQPLELNDALTSAIHNTVGAVASTGALV